MKGLFVVALLVLAGCVESGNETQSGEGSLPRVGVGSAAAYELTVASGAQSQSFVITNQILWDEHVFGGDPYYFVATSALGTVAFGLTRISDGASMMEVEMTVPTSCDGACADEFEVSGSNPMGGVDLPLRVGSAWSVEADGVRLNFEVTDLANFDSILGTTKAWEVSYTLHSEEMPELHGVSWIDQATGVLLDDFASLTMDGTQFSAHVKLTNYVAKDLQRTEEQVVSIVQDLMGIAPSITPEGNEYVILDPLAPLDYDVTGSVEITVQASGATSIYVMGDNVSLSGPAPFEFTPTKPGAYEVSAHLDGTALMDTAGLLVSGTLEYTIPCDPGTSHAASLCNPIAFDVPDFAEKVTISSLGGTVAVADELSVDTGLETHEATGTDGVEMTVNAVPWGEWTAQIDPTLHVTGTQTLQVRVDMLSITSASSSDLALRLLQPST